MNWFVSKETSLSAHIHSSLSQWKQYELFHLCFQDGQQENKVAEQKLTSEKLHWQIIQLSVYNTEENLQYALYGVFKAQSFSGFEVAAHNRA